MEDFTSQGFPLYVAWPDGGADDASTPEDVMSVGVVVGWTEDLEPYVVLLDSQPDLDMEDHRLRLLDGYRDKDRGAIFDTDLNRLRERLKDVWR